MLRSTRMMKRLTKRGKSARISAALSRTVQHNFIHHVVARRHARVELGIRASIRTRKRHDASTSRQAGRKCLESTFEGGMGVTLLLLAAFGIAVALTWNGRTGLLPLSLPVHLQARASNTAAPGDRL